jgi:hypothetical protein
VKGTRLFSLSRGEEEGKKKVNFARSITSEGSERKIAPVPLH